MSPRFFDTLGYIQIVRTLLSNWDCQTFICFEIEVGGLYIHQCTAG